MLKGRIAARAATALAAVALMVSCILWVWTSGVYYRTLATPALAVCLPAFTLQACAYDHGVNFLAVRRREARAPRVQFAPATHLGKAGYPESRGVRALGLEVAVLPSTYDGGDYSIPPHLALVLPYWLLTTLTAAVLLASTGAAAWMGARSRLIWQKHRRWGAR